MTHEAPALPAPDDALGVFVSPRGSDTNPGTRAAPLASPRRAIEQARREGRGSVFLAAGDYVDELRTAVSLYGGYSEDFASLDPERYATRITGPDGGHATTAVTIEDGAPVLHGLSLRGGASKHATAVTIRGASRPTIVRCSLHGGGRGPGPDGFTYSHGVDVPFGERPAFTLLACEVHGGRNQYAWAIDGLGDGCLVEGCTLVGGGCATPNSSTYGVRGGGRFTLRGNRIDAGSGASALGVTLHGDGAAIEGNAFTTPRRNRWDALVVHGEGAPALSGNTLDGVADEVFFAFAKKLERRQWRFNEVDGDQWSYEVVTLEPWGWLHFAGDSAIEPTGGGYTGPSQSFRDFLARGPAVATTPAAVADEIRALLLAAGVE